MNPRTRSGGDVRPLAVGYLRVQAADPPGIAAALTARMGAYADREGLMLAAFYTDLLDSPAGHPDRAGFCALMDALRRDDVYAVVIPSHPSELGTATTFRSWP